MKTFNVIQGTPDWAALRFSVVGTASEAPAMMGASSKATRTQLLHMKATGNEKEFSRWVQENLLDKGHAIEADTRPLVEEMIGEDLYPTTCGTDDGRLLASPDGITMDGLTGFECKSWNEKLVAMVRANELSPEYYWQLEHQLLCCEMEKILFVVSDGTLDNFEALDYYPVKGRREALLAGWKQFEEDLKNYKHVESLPATPGKSIMALPTLSVRLIGEVTESNLALYKEKALGFIENISTELKTDEDFATAELSVKFCSDAEKELETVKSMALAQTATIDELFRTVDQIKESMRAKRLQLEKLVTTRKDTIRAEIRQEGVDAFAAHLRMLSERTDHAMPTVPVDFAAAMKGKKTVASLRSAVADELARAKIAANEVADKIEINMRVFRVLAADHLFLFSDVRTLCHKPADDFKAAVELRIAKHVEEKRLEEEATRERIRQQELARIENERIQRESVEAKARSTAALADVVATANSVHDGWKGAFAPGPAAAPALVGDWQVAVDDLGEVFMFLAENEQFHKWAPLDLQAIALYAKLSDGAPIPGLRFFKRQALAA